MKYLIVVFKSKTEVFSFIDELIRVGVVASTTGTPKEAGIGCGISAKVDYMFLPAVKSVIAKNCLGGYHAAYLISKDGMRVSKTRITL